MFLFAALLSCQGCTVHFAGVPLWTAKTAEGGAIEAPRGEKPRERDYRLRNPLLFGFFLVAGAAMVSYQVYRTVDLADRVSEEF